MSSGTGAILLIAAKRQDSISAAMAQHDFDTNVAAKAEIDQLLLLGRQHAQMIGELRDLVAALTPPSASGGYQPLLRTGTG